MTAAEHGHSLASRLRLQAPGSAHITPLIVLCEDFISIRPIRSWSWSDRCLSDSRPAQTSYRFDWTCNWVNREAGGRIRRSSKWCGLLFIKLNRSCDAVGCPVLTMFPSTAETDLCLKDPNNMCPSSIRLLLQDPIWHWIIKATGTLGETLREFWLLFGKPLPLKQALTHTWTLHLKDFLNVLFSRALMQKVAPVDLVLLRPVCPLWFTKPSPAEAGRLT